MRFFGPNDGFILAALVAEYSLVLLLPPRLPKSVAALVMLIGLAHPLVWDHTVGTEPFDLYDTNIYPWLTIDDVLTWAMYPPLAYLFVYIYDRLQVRALAIPLYLLGWSIAGTAFEWLAAAFGVFNYKGWPLKFSFLVYLIVESITAILFRMLMKQFHQAPKAARRS